MSDPIADLHIVVLAAGASTRLGQPKQLARLADGPALRRVVASAVSVAGHAVTVVLGAHAADITRVLKASSASIVINRHWEEGLASSLRSGLLALPGNCHAALILLGDQVAVTGDDLKRLVSGWGGHDTVIAASVYQGHVGVPAIFPRWCFSELCELRGDTGARAILNRYAERIIRVPMSNAAIDLDTPEDLARLQNPGSQTRDYKE